MTQKNLQNSSNCEIKSTKLCEMEPTKIVNSHLNSKRILERKKEDAYLKDNLPHF